MLVFLLRVESLSGSLKQRRKNTILSISSHYTFVFCLENDFEQTTEAKRGISLSLEHCLFFNFVWWCFSWVLEVTLSELAASVPLLDVAKKVMVPKRKLVLSCFYKPFIIPQNIPKRPVHICPEKLWDNILGEQLGVNTVIWLLLSSQLGTLCHFNTDGAWFKSYIVHWWTARSDGGHLGAARGWFLFF